MKIKEMSELIAQSSDVKSKASPAAIRAVYSVILSELEKDGVDALVFNGLGKFVVKKVENKEGNVTKRIMFRAAKPSK